MEPLQLALLIVCSILAGCMLAVVWIYHEMKMDHLAKAQELAKVKSDFTDSIAKAAEVNNAWAAKAVQMSDQLLAHEMILKGSKRG